MSTQATLPTTTGSKGGSWYCMAVVSNLARSLPRQHFSQAFEGAYDGQRCCLGRQLSRLQTVCCHDYCKCWLYSCLRSTCFYWWAAWIYFMCCTCDIVFYWLLHVYPHILLALKCLFPFCRHLCCNFSGLRSGFYAFIHFTLRKKDLLWQ